MGRMMSARLSGLALTCTLAACAVGPNFHHPAPPPDKTYGGAPSRGETAAAAGTGGNAQTFVENQDIAREWWTLFQSPSLNQLVERALKENPNLTAAQAALRQANELYLAQRGSLWPQLTGGFAATRAKNAVATIANPTTYPQVNPYYNLFTADLAVSYVPDVFGGTRRAVEASKAQAESARFQFEATYVTLTTNVVVTAIEEASLRGQIAATERLLVLQQTMSDIVRKQRELGTASELDLLTQETLEAQTAATLPPLVKALGQTRDALTALVGRLPAEEPVETFRLEELTLPSQLPLTLPSKLVEQRPDVRQAEENLHMASAEAGVALAEMLPQFAITGDLGSSALALNQLFTPYTGFWSIGASLTQVLFAGGTLYHHYKAADAALDQAGAQYRAAVIQACQNVADTLRALGADADALKANAAADSAAKKFFDLARQQQSLGAISLVALMNAEQAYEQAELALVQAEANRYADTAALFQALGGGWWNSAGGGTK